MIESVDRMTMRAVTICVALCWSCTVQPLGPAPAPEPPPAPAPAPEPAPVGACDRACDKLRELGCSAYEPDCVAACQNIEDKYAAGVSELTLNPDCIGRITACEQANTVCRDER